VLDLDHRTDPWQPRRAVWPLLAVIDEARGQDWAALLWAYLGDRPTYHQPPGPDVVRGARRWSTAQHLAELFAAYAGSRPEMVRSWRHGRDVDGAGQPLAAELAWQAELWRRLRAELGTPSPAERTDHACELIAASAAAVDLPGRLSVFGASRLAPEHRSVLMALACHRDVHLWLPHPSPVLWERIARETGTTMADGPRSAEPTAELASHPLLGYLGRDVRELQLTLAAGSASRGVPGGGPRVTDTHYAAPARPAPATLLARLQDDLRADQGVRPEAQRPLLAPDDRSVQVYASHGPDRQVEVLREVLVGLLADDPTLEPRDIVVMCPDIERFAPLISASFGLHSEDQSVQHPGHRLRVRLADRALRQINPLLAALSRVLALVDSRVEASSLLDLCAFGPIAHKFHFTDDDLERLRDLVLRSGVRWGLGPEHRRSFSMGQFAQNTWAAGLDRLLLGVTMDESGQHFIGTALPLDDVDSSDVDLVGRLAELVDRVRGLMVELESPRPLPAWVDLCRRAIDLLAAVPAQDSWQVSHAYAELGSLAQSAPDHLTTELSLSEIRALLADTFRGRATRANFRTGTLTMCTMMPMRSVPHRVICLLGVDDGVFPRANVRDGDDILAARPWVGDRDPRSEDRQLLLDAILAAEERLLVIYGGADPRTRAVRPPAVPIGALLDALDVTARTAGGSRVSDHVVIKHPLQPFEPVNFVPGKLPETTTEPFSFDQGSLQGARAAAAPRRRSAADQGEAALAPFVTPEVVELADLIRFFHHPVKALLRVRAGLVTSREEDDPGDQIPVRLDGLESWAMGDRLLRLHLDGVDVEQLVAAEWRRGSLPPRSLGGRALAPVVDNVRQIAAAGARFLDHPRSQRDVLAVTGGHTVSGTLSHIYGDRLVTVNYSWLGAKHRMQAWIELLALTASHPGRPWQAVTVGRAGRSDLGPVPVEWAGPLLGDLLEIYRLGLSEPLALAPKVVAEYARIRHEGKSVQNFSDKLDKLWGEERDPAYERFFGPGVRLETLLQEPGRAEEARGDLAEPSRLGTLARRVWQPLLRAEELS
jgi:exodeoxyribonuclease V gamma subunit